ncbi:MAG TPA: hypothetical protein VGL33_11680 [Streptosporangiaceae bacterium]
MLILTLVVLALPRLVLIAVCRRLYHSCLTAPTFAGGPPPYPGVAA